MPGTPCPGLQRVKRSNPSPWPQGSDPTELHVGPWPPPHGCPGSDCSRDQGRPPTVLKNKATLSAAHSSCPVDSQALLAGPIGASPEVQGECEPLRGEVELFSPTPYLQQLDEPLEIARHHRKVSREWGCSGDRTHALTCIYTHLHAPWRAPVHPHH